MLIKKTVTLLIIYIFSLGVASFASIEGNLYPNNYVTDNPYDDEVLNNSASNPQFTFNNTCFGNSTSFQVSDTTDIDSIQWNFGDLASSNNIIWNSYSVFHTFSDTGSFLVSMTVFYNGNSLTYIENIYISPIPEAGFSVNSQKQCLDKNHFYFTNHTNSQNMNVSYLWEFGEGITKTSENTDYTFANSGVFMVKLTATNEYGCFDTNSKQVIVSNRTTPNAGFILDDTTQCLKGNFFGFLNTSTTTSGSLNYVWAFGDSENSSLENPTHTYLTPDTFTVKLIATADYGCSDSAFGSIIVMPHAYTSFSTDDNDQCLKNNLFTFTNNSTYPSGKISSRWDFGDNQESYNNNPVHSYKNHGVFQVKLITSTENLCRDTATKNITVRPMPKADFVINNSRQCFDEQNFKFINSTTITYGSFSNTWYLNNNKISQAHIPVLGKLQADTFYLSLKTISTYHCMDSVAKKIIVFPEPTAGFVVNNDLQCLENNQYEFTNTSTIKNGNLNFKWDLGDNTQKQTKHITHSYSEANLFRIQMIAVSDQMCTDTIEKTIETKPDPIAQFSIDNAEQCFLNNSFTLSNKSHLSKGKYNSYWEISDEFISSDKNIIHHFETPNTYTATLIVETEYHCKDTASAELIVNPMPSADFEINNQNQCLNENRFVFTNKSTISEGPLEYIWSFGNGEGSYDKNPIHRFHKTDSFKICLKVLSDKGCIDSASQYIKVNPSPVANFITDAEGKCLDGNVFEFTNLSSVESGQIESIWHTGDNNISKDFNLTHTFESDGNYNVTLKVISEQNCADSTQLKVSVYPMPEVKFTIGQACLNENIYFLDKSTIKKPEFLADWGWNFGNGDGAFTQNPVYQYKKPGTYKVILSTISNHNCATLASEYIKINPNITQPSIEKTTIIDNQKILVEWKKPEGKNLVKYVLERRTNNQDYILIDSFESYTSYYIDEKVNVNLNRYSYRLRSLDSCYHESPNSNIGNNILLQIDENEEYPLVTWSKYPALNLDGIYEIYYLDPDNLLPQYLTAVDASSDFFKDSLTNYNTSSYCYQVYAKKDNEILSTSNIGCTPTLLTAFVPNVFTPNGDELNDIFRVKGKNILELTMYIYDKWGDLVFYTENIDEGWDGRYMNKDLPTDSYKYIIQLKGVNDQTREFIGYVSLFR